MPHISPEKFREEAQRRLIDRYELMILLGLRSRQAVADRIEAGKLPPPVTAKTGHPALWDRDDIEFPTTGKVG